MSEVTFEQLLECGTHFGHQTFRWNPKMKPYILTSKNKIHIINLQKTLDNLKVAQKLVAQTIKAGKSVIFVGTKKQAREIIKEEAERCGMFYVNHRWLGGMLTNYETVRKSIKKLEKIEKMEEDENQSLLTKKELSKLNKKKEKLILVLGGIRNMKKMPGLFFIVDTKKEYIAVTEARKLGIDIIGMVDTNTDPSNILCPIPGNDDSIKSIRLITKTIADAVIDATGKEKLKQVKEEKAVKKAEEKEVKKNVAKKETVKKTEEKATKEKKETKKTPKRKRTEA